MTDHVETVARAICLSNDIGPDEFYYDGNEPWWRRYIPDAEAAIAAYQQSCASEAVAYISQEYLGNLKYYGDIHAYHPPISSKKYGDYQIPVFAAPPAPAVPAGWKLVPVEPTEAMLDAYWHRAGESKEMRPRTHHSAKSYYAAMIAAAPEAP